MSKKLTVQKNNTILSIDNGVRNHPVFDSTAHKQLSIMLFHQQLADSKISTIQEEGGRKRRWRDCGGEKGQD